MFRRYSNRKGSRRYFSKRDASTFFDLLQAPSEIQRFFGRPSLKIQELQKELRYDLQALCALIDDAGDARIGPETEVHPVSAVWPMGFSWSSYVAQCQLLQVCCRAGLHESQFLADDADAPTDLSETCALATDDVMVFTRRCRPSCGHSGSS